MDVFKYFTAELDAVVGALAADGVFGGDAALPSVAVEAPRDPSHGDLATNAALVLARAAGLKPRDLAGRIALRLGEVDGVEAVRVAGPGFINLTLTHGCWTRSLAEILRQGAAYGRSRLGAGRRINVEYVSANPTGPMHVGHARGAVFGDVLASLLERAGFDVTREYYVNDAGFQIDQLAYSVYFRYLEALDQTIDEESFGALFAGREWDYRGDYLKPVGAALAAEFGDRWVGEAERNWLPVFRDRAVEAMMAVIREDLDALGVRMDRFTSERALIAAGKVESVLSGLGRRDLIHTGVLAAPKGRPPDDWEPRPQTLFRSTAFGDDSDRALKKSDGSWTYFASDIAYHLDKVERGFAELINVWGADHGGYVKRMKAAVQAISDGKATLDVKLCQLVNLLDGGEPVKMSKRAGRFVTLRDVVDAVGKDAVRFIMLTRRNDAALDFDFAAVTERSRDNPVFYVQYAHARICSVERHAASIRGLGEAANEDDLERLADADEIGLIKMLAAWPRLVEAAAEAHEPHRIAFYLYDLASAFHALWNRGNADAAMRFLRPEDAATSRARLALLRAVKLVIGNGLETFGVAAPEEMR